MNTYTYIFQGIETKSFFFEKKYLSDINLILDKKGAGDIKGVTDKLGT